MSNHHLNIISPGDVLLSDRLAQKLDATMGEWIVDVQASEQVGRNLTVSRGTVPKAPEDAGMSPALAQWVNGLMERKLVMLTAGAGMSVDRSGPGTYRLERA